MDVQAILDQCTAIEAAVAEIRTQCADQPAPEPPVPPQIVPLDRAEIIDAVVSSPVPNISWKDRGIAPIGYAKGMGLAYAMAFRNWLMSQESDENSFVVKMAMANTGDDHADAISWYNSNFRNLGMNNDRDGKDTLRHLFVLMYGLGMRESSGKFCEGRDQSADNVSADSAEAGLFQTSYDSRYGCADIATLLGIYKELPDDPQKVGPTFHEGVSCSTTDLQNYGSSTSDGWKFQYYSKASPIFAIQCAGVGMREIGGDNGHWGPLRRKEAELKTDVDELFQEIETIVEEG